MRKELAGNPYSSMPRQKRYGHGRTNIGDNTYGYDILWVCFLMSMRSVQRGLNYRISSCNFIADWTIVMGKISIVGLALAISQLATTDLPERSHQPGPDFIFPQCSFGKTNTLGFQSELFFTTMRLRTQLSATLA